jgi:hypothetical protein
MLSLPTCSICPTSASGSVLESLLLNTELKWMSLVG